jgi:hypothetical protein
MLDILTERAEVDLKDDDLFYIFEDAIFKMLKSSANYANFSVEVK